MPHNENSRVKIPALVHFTRLGYKYISLRKYEGVIDDDTNILVDVLCDAINRINATSLTTTDVQKIVNALKAMLENDDLGREFYSVLINGYNGLKLIDFEDFGGTVNSYHVVTEMTCKNGSDEFRPDITPLINGIPLAFIEVKKPNNKGGIKAEYDRMLMRVKNKKFRRFINLTQIMVFSNNSEYDDTEAVPLEGAFYSTISYEYPYEYGNMPTNLINVQFYLQQISQVIEKIGYMQAGQNGLTIFVEKDPAAIAVAEGEFIPESLSYRLISYNHYSMKGNLAEKKTTLLDLANLLEPQRTILERIDKTFSSDLFYTFNNFHIRHNNIDQLGTKYKKPVGDLSDEQLEYWYDEVYQMCLLAFMRLEHIDRKKKFDSLKSQIEGT